jgi:hypothetical protein
MLSKTAMALVPAASLVGPGARSRRFASWPWRSRRPPAWHSRARTTVSSPSTIPIARKTLGTASVGETLPPTLAPRSVAKVGEWFPRTASSPLQKKLNRAG